MISSFSELDLSPKLIDILSQLSLTQPTKVQEIAIPIALEGRDLLASAPTGTGKTLAFLLPIWQHLLDQPKSMSISPRILILAPTRELAQQIYQTALVFCGAVKSRAILITGGADYEQDDAILNQAYDVLIATPGRLSRYLKQEKLELDEVEMLILDEADRMLDMGFKDQVEAIAKQCTWRNQTLLFSATLESKAVSRFAAQLLNDPVNIEVESSRKERKKINQYYYRADDLAHKKELLVHLLRDPELERVIIFVKKREQVHELTSFLQSRAINVCFLEGEMDQMRRTEALKRIKNKAVSILVATDVASRGLDVDDISHVINFDMPKTADVYVHRIGRTARAGKKGSAIALVEAHDFPLLSKMTRYMQEPIKMRVIDELRPKTKAPKFKNKKKKTQNKKKNVKKHSQ